MSTDAIPTADPVESSLSDRERIVLAACRAVLARGEPLTWKAMAVEMRNRSDWTLAAYRRLGALGLVPWRGPGYRPAPPPVGADGLTDLERDCLDACRVSPPPGKRRTREDVRRRVRKHSSRVSAVLRKLVTLRLIDGDTLELTAAGRELSPSTPPISPAIPPASPPASPPTSEELGLSPFVARVLDAVRALVAEGMHPNRERVRDRLGNGITHSDVSRALRYLTEAGLVARRPHTGGRPAGTGATPETPARRPRPAMRDHDDPCHEAVADYRRAWGRIRTLLLGKEVLT